jgi:hypothetical protein
MDAMSRKFELGVTEDLRAAGQTRGCDNAALRQIKCHTMQSNLAPKLLKTQDWHPHKVTHFFEPAFTSQSSGDGQQGRHAA